MQIEKVTDYIVDWLKDYANNANIKGFVIGISGALIRLPLLPLR